MGNVQKKLKLRCVKLLDAVLITALFGVSWYLYYAENMTVPYYKNGNYLVLLLYMILFITFGKVYEGFQISMKRISEIIYSQILAALAADGILYLITWLLSRKLPRLYPLLAAFLFQCMMVMLWAFTVHHWYFHVFPPKKTAVIFDEETGVQKLISEYGLEKKYDVQHIFSVEECRDQLSVLDEMETVFISGVHSHDRNAILKYCIGRDIEVMVIPRIGDIIMSGAHPIHMFHLPMLGVRRYDVSLEYLFLKRLLDIVISAAALLFFCPVMLAVAAAIKIYDGGPAFYTQIRLTKDGKTFRIFKFRSMRTDAEKDGVARLSTGENDSRITPVGKFIRKYRLDELPQLLNILMGQLSICGPRPERPEIAAEYCKKMPEFALRLQAKAGLTGYAQVYGKYNTNPYDKLQMDLMYIARPSIIEDLKIMMATVKILFMAESTEGVAQGQTTAEK